jgi:Na+-driven multidrug efflux pump
MHRPGRRIALLLVLESCCRTSAFNAPRPVHRPLVVLPKITPRGNSVATATLEIGGENVNDDKEEPTYPPAPSYRECYTFAANAVGIYAAPTLMSLIDAAFIGRVSTTELAALGPGGTISDSVPFFLLFVSIAATNLMAKSSAANDTHGSALISRTCIAFGGLSGLALAVATIAGAGPLSELYCGANVALAPLCARYVCIRALALPFVVVASVAQALCIGAKDTRTPMLAVAVAAALNLCGDMIAVNVLHLGLAGAAWATALSQLCAAGLLLRVLFRRGLLGAPPRPQMVPSTARDEKHSKEHSRGDGAAGGASPATHRGTLLAICSFASFIFVMCVKVGVHNVCAATSASFGGAPAAAHTALMAVAWLCFTFGDVGSSLAQTYLPAFSSAPPAPPLRSAMADSDGATEAEKADTPSVRFDMEAAWPTIAMLLRVTFSISLLVVGLSGTIVGALVGQLTPDLAVQQQMRQVMPLMLATLATHGAAVTLEGLLLARKAFRGLALTYGAMAVSIAAALSFVRTSGAGLAGVWLVYVWYCFGRVLAFAGLGGLLDWRPRDRPRFVATKPGER